MFSLGIGKGAILFGIGIVLTMAAGLYFMTREVKALNVEIGAARASISVLTTANDGWKEREESRDKLQLSILNGLQDLTKSLSKIKELQGTFNKAVETNERSKDALSSVELSYYGMWRPGGALDPGAGSDSGKDGNPGPSSDVRK